MSFINNKGSLWRIWDLHVHTPATYGGTYQDFIKNAEQSTASVIGINDYCTLNGYEEVVKLGRITGKEIFPVVEFRMHNLLITKHNKNGIRINFHIIFDNHPHLFPVISTWLKSLKCFNEKGEYIQLGVVQDLSKISFDFEKVIESLKEHNLYKDKALIWIPYDEYGGIDEVDPVTDGLFKTAIINKSHLIGTSTAKQIDFFHWNDKKFSKEQYRLWFEKPKPCIKGSDAHKIDYPFGHLQNKDSQPTNKYCWIKADTTFKGLKQIIIEPDRVYIGEEPSLLTRIRENKTKFIKSLLITKKQNTSIDDIWFDNTVIKFNAGLVAIIGKKGSGKSAISEILSLCGNTHQDFSNFSFLNNTKFRRSKPYNLSEKFEASLTWEDGNSVVKGLEENSDLNLSERVKYIPQNFFEKLCANVESEEFENEIKDIIYAHTPTEKKFDKTSLDELINYKSSLVNDEIIQIKNEISQLNNEIIKLEVKNTKEYKATIDDKIKIKKEELEAHLSSKPVEPNPDLEINSNSELTTRLSELREKIKSLEESIKEKKKNLTLVSLKNEELNRALKFYENLDEQLKKITDDKNEFVQILKKNNLSLDGIFNYKIKIKPISELINSTKSILSVLNNELNSQIETSLVNQLEKLQVELKKDQDDLAKPERERQKYIDDLKNWEDKKLIIYGDEETENSLKYIEKHLEYLKTELLSELKTKYEIRKGLVKKLFEKKSALLDIRKELFQPVTKFINDFQELKERYDVNLDVTIELRSFPDNFFNFINQQKKGTFSGKEEGYKKLIEIVDKSNFISAEGFISFSNELLGSLTNDNRTVNKDEVDIHSQLRKGVDLNQLYDFLFSFDYLQPVYNLKLGNKTLEELSPGERGALLLIFYLILDNSDLPLLIDQPEENLDNESVYHILVHFIKRVKEKRQIIIVTHNPNLAVVCDADQIIVMDIEKDNKNKVKILSGSIENENINSKIVDILEGTMPAFDNRDLKYIRA
jgi:ABC-type lipoprotein export system ATPase subunit